MTVAEQTAVDNLNKMLARRASRVERIIPEIVCFGVYEVSSSRVVCVFENFYRAQTCADRFPFPARVVSLRGFDRSVL